MKKATVKWFNAQKGYGFITDTQSNEDVFVHYSSIIMFGFRILNEDDIVQYELGAGKDGRKYAVNVKPILTRSMIEKKLRKDGLHIQMMEDAYNVKKYLVVDENNMIKSDENGMSFLELAAYAGFDTDGLEES